MKLKSALKSVLSLTTKDKTKSVFNKIRFEANPSGVFVSDGICSSFIYVDDPLIDCVVDASVLSQIVKDKGELALTNSDQIGKICLCNPYNVYHLPCSSDPYPFSIYPRSDYLFQAVDLTKLDSIIFSASKTSKDGGFPYLHFADNYVEATDGNRLSRLYWIFPYNDLVVPVELFNKWPKKLKKSAVYKDDYFLYFMLDDEIRIVILSDRKYPNTDIVVKDKVEKNHCFVNRKQFLEIVKQASNISEINGISIDFSTESLLLRALGKENISDIHIGNFQAESGHTKVDFLVGVNGTMLSQGLQHLKSDMVELIYSKYPDPLILSTQDVSMYIWPMINE